MLKCRNILCNLILGLILLIFGYNFLLINSQIIFGCPLDSCKLKPGQDIVCPEFECDTENGERVLRNASDCGCCHLCLKPLGENEKCLKSLYALPREECGPGLSCIQGTCQKSTQECIKEQSKPGFALGKPIPKCDIAGKYEAVQCAKGRGCYCVNKDGERIFGNSLEDAKKEMDCSCSRSFDSFRKLKRYFKVGSGDFPRCQSNGNFVALQCTDSSCFCLTGDGKIDGNPVPADENFIPGLNCFDPVNSRHAWTSPCFDHFKNIRELEENMTSQYGDLKGETTVLGLDYPNCDLDGNYAPKQCNSTRCYCVNKNGEMYPEKHVGAPRNSAKSKTMTCACKREQDLLLSLPLADRKEVAKTILEMECDFETGDYVEIQNVYGMFICVDQWGFQWSVPSMEQNCRK